MLHNIHFNDLSQNISACRGIVDLMFLLDSSGSIQASNFHFMKMWLQGVVEQFDVESDRADIGVITFSENAK